MIETEATARLAIPNPHMSAPTKNQMRAHEIDALLNDPSIQVLSLDCFDTLIWRKTATPIDVFYEVQNTPSFKKLGFTARLRAQAESKARQFNLFKHVSSEIKLRDIYLSAFPYLTSEQLDELEHDEMNCELAACYAFPPMVKLIENAADRGVKVIIVSDTYFTEKQLRSILQHCLTPQTYQLIKKVFASSEYGKSKTVGLFHKVLATLNCPAKRMLHFGDHPLADFHSPKMLGIKAMHFLQQDELVRDLLRMQSVAASLLNMELRSARALTSPFQGLLANTSISLDNPEKLVGYVSLGTIMYGFGMFILNEIKQLQASGKSVKVAFLLRDGHLPAKVCERLFGSKVGATLRISRFASYASTFRNKDDIEFYISQNVNSLRFYDICNQLLIPEDKINVIMEAIRYSSSPIIDFLKQIRKDEIIQLIIHHSTQFRQRLYKHLNKELDLQSGDTLMLIDLGYKGTAQNLLAPVMLEELNVEVIGRYLLALATPGWEKDRRGLLDPSAYDERILYMLVSYIALFEQLCTCNEPSSVNYDEEGNAIFSTVTLEKQQHTKLDHVQAECLRFIDDAKAFYGSDKTSISTEQLRDVAMHELARLIYLPSAPELAYLKSFEFDLNLGAKDVLKVFDENQGLTGLRKRGLFFMERNLNTMRTNYPAELRHAGLELSIALMTQHRVRYDALVNDFSLRREKVNVIVSSQGEASQSMIDAIPTHDGYFSLIIPIGEGQFTVGVQFGLAYQWIQIESAESIPTITLYRSNETENSTDISSQLAVQEMVDRSGGLFECLSTTSMLVYIPSQQKQPSTSNEVIRIVFRPIVSREKGM